MKRIQRIGLLLAMLAGVVVISCKKEKSLEGGNGGSSGPAAWEFKEGASLFKGPMDTAYYSNLGGVTALVLEGSSSSNPQEAFYMEIFGTSITTGTYATPTVFFEYSSGGTILYTNDPLAINKFSVTISSIDSAGVSGTFTGEVKDTAGNVKVITDGKFAAKFITVAPPPSGNGQLMLWAQQGCSNRLLVSVNGQLDTITAFQPSAPSCGTAGTAFFTLPAGTYTWKAVCEGATDTVSGSVSVTAGSCTAKEINLNANPGITTCKISNLASYDLGNGAKISAITSSFNAQNQVTKTQLIDSSSQSGGTIEKEFNFVYATSQINVDAKQYFVLEPAGRIREFHGYADPSDDSTVEVIITYSYDANGYMTQASIALKSAPFIPVLVYVYQWTGGDLTKVTATLITGEKSVIDYQYDPAKQAKGFLALHSNPEITLFQNVVNYGKNTANLPVKSTWTNYLANGSPDGSPFVGDFKNYVYDANGYIRSFEIAGTGSAYGAEIKHVLSYKCF